MSRAFDVSFLKSITKDKNSFVKIGVAFQEETNGRIDVLLDCLPLGEWNGKLTLFPKESKK